MVFIHEKSNRKLIRSIYVSIILVCSEFLQSCSNAHVNNLEYPSARFVLAYVQDENNRSVQNKSKPIKGEPELSGLFERLDLAENMIILSSRRSGIGKTLPDGFLPTTIVLIQSAPRKLVQLPQAKKGIAIYREEGGNFKLIYSECEFGSKMVELKPYDDSKGNQGVTYAFNAGLSRPGASVPIFWVD